MFTAVYISVLVLSAGFLTDISVYVASCVLCASAILSFSCAPAASGHVGLVRVVTCVGSHALLRLSHDAYARSRPIPSFHIMS